MYLRHPCPTRISDVFLIFLLLVSLLTCFDTVLTNIKHYNIRLLICTPHYVYFDLPLPSSSHIGHINTYIIIPISDCTPTVAPLMWLQAMNSRIHSFSSPLLNELTDAWRSNNFTILDEKTHAIFPHVHRHHGCVTLIF